MEKESSPDTQSNVSLNKRLSLHLVVKQYGECETAFSKQDCSFLQEMTSFLMAAANLWRNTRSPANTTWTSNQFTQGQVHSRASFRREKRLGYLSLEYMFKKVSRYTCGRFGKPKDSVQSAAVRCRARQEASPCPITSLPCQVKGVGSHFGSVQIQQEQNGSSRCSGCGFLILDCTMTAWPPMESSLVTFSSSASLPETEKAASLASYSVVLLGIFIGMLA